MRWMNLEPVIQSEVSQKEKKKYCILTHIYGIQKDGTDEPICRARMEIPTQRTDLWTWKQPRCPLTDEWIKRMWYTYTMDYYSAIKRDEFESLVVRWMNLEPVIQREVSQKEKNKYHIVMHIYGI